MLTKLQKIDAVDVYLENRKTREYVGQLSRENALFIFTYSDLYLYKSRSIPLGPDLPLTQKKFMSNTLFPSFEDRIPSNKNPAYPEYCNMVGIDPSEHDPLILVATLGQKGPSSFIYTPAPRNTITGSDVAAFRKNLNLTVREFAELFDFSPATISKIEKNAPLGRDVLRRLEIYYYFPEVAIYMVMKNRFKVNDEKISYAERFLSSQVDKRPWSFMN